MELFDNFLLSFLKDFHFKDLSKIKNAVSTVHLKKHDIYFEEGKYHKKVFYVKKGIIRGFVVNDNGEDRTVVIAGEKDFGADPNCFLEKKPAKLTWSVIEDCSLLEIDFDVVDEISRNNATLLRMRLSFNQKILSRFFTRIESFVVNSPEERYYDFYKKNPDLCNRVPDKHLASFLGITPVSLSRIKKRSTN